MNRENGKLIFGLVAGAVAGAVGAIMLAPSSGAETRRKLMNSTQRLTDDFNSTIQSGLDKINELRGAEEPISGPTTGRVQTTGTSYGSKSTSDRGTL